MGYYTRYDGEIRDDGTVTRKYATALVPMSGEPYKGYSIIETVEAVIAAFPGHEFTGRFDCEGEDTADLWRLVVRGRVAPKVEPRIVWPDEES